MNCIEHPQVVSSNENLLTHGIFQDDHHIMVSSQHTLAGTLAKIVREVQSVAQQSVAATFADHTYEARNMLSEWFSSR